MEKLICSASEFSQMLENTLSDNAAVPLCVTGTSMLPFLAQGRDTVWLSRCSKENLKRGSIVLFKRNDGTLVLHRIYKAGADGKLTVNGDAQSWCETVNSTQILATVQYIERNGKKINCADISFRLSSKIWMLLKPFRPVLLRLIK